MGKDCIASRLFVALMLGCSSSPTTPPTDAGLDGGGDDDGNDGNVIDAATKAEFLYSYSYNSSALLAFPVNLSTGVVTAPASFSAPPNGGGILAAPLGEHLYVSDGKTDSVYAFSINASTGALTPIAGSPFPLGNPSGFASALAMDPAGHFLYATDAIAQNIIGFSVNNSTGALTRLQGAPVPTGANPLGALVEPQGRVLYVANNGDVSNGSISAYAINSISGTLTPVPGSPFPTIANGGPQFLVAHPSGKFLYVNLPGGKPATNVVGAYAIGSNGALTPVVGSPYATGSYPLGVAIDSAGKLLYTANSLDGTISAFTIDSNSGALTAISGSPFSAGLGAGGLPRGPFDVRVDLATKVLYCSDGTGPDLLSFSIDSNGALGAPMVTDTNGADTLYLEIAKVQ